MLRQTLEPGAIHELLLGRFGVEKILAFVSETRDPWIELQPAAIEEVCRFAKFDEALRFDSLADLCGVDYLEVDPKKKQPVEPHLEVVYHLFSFVHRHRIKLKVRLPRWAGEPGTLPELPSVAGVWKTADWHEREAYDLVGIRFTGHPNLTRILCAEDWVGHPLRKDYDFPLEYHGIRGR